MGRNIVLFSDGTGNKGGKGPETNVFKLYHAIKGGTNKRDQLTYYDNGVGTSSHAVARAIGGATGAGFKQNVRDLYEFTSRHYQDGDDIYGFGFSRGAATIRAFVGMVHHCGLVRKHTGKKDENGDDIILAEDEFQRQIDAAMTTYVSRGSKVSLGRLWQAIFKPDLQYDKHEVKIEFLGLWDTVSALGFPQIPPLDAAVNFLRRHHFYDYEPTGSVKHVFQAVAVDDERRTFWPLIWDETGFQDEQHIEQVWFAGVHSNVGGGYSRAGLANITLDWMIARLEGHLHSIGGNDNDRGLVLETSFVADVYDGNNPYGKLYDSRAGFALMYRYQPRPITALCAGRLRGDRRVRIHASVLDRMELRTAGYGPGQLPDSFDQVETPDRTTKSTPALMSSVVSSVNLKSSQAGVPTGEWQPIRDEIDKATVSRIVLYWTFLLASLAILAMSFYFWVSEVEYGGFDDAWRNATWANWLFGHIADILHYFLPVFFHNIISYAFLKQPWWGIGFFIIIIVYYLLRSKFRQWSDDACEKARCFVLRCAGRSL